MTRDKDYKIHKEWKDNEGDILKLCSIKGKYKFLSHPDKEDRLFFIKINDGPEFIIKHEHQVELMVNILKNDILNHAFISNWNRFNNALKELWEERFGK